MPGGVPVSGRPALSSAAMPQRDSSVTTRAAKPRSGVTSAARRSLSSSASRSASAMASASSPSCAASTMATPSKAATMRASSGRPGRRHRSVVSAGRSASETRQARSARAGVTRPITPMDSRSGRPRAPINRLELRLRMARGGLAIADRGPADGVEVVVEPRQHHRARGRARHGGDEVARRRRPNPSSPRRSPARPPCPPRSGRPRRREGGCAARPVRCGPIAARCAGQWSPAMARKRSVRSQYRSWRPACSSVRRPSASKGTRSICSPSMKRARSRARPAASPGEDGISKGSSSPGSGRRALLIARLQPRISRVRPIWRSSGATASGKSTDAASASKAAFVLVELAEGQEPRQDRGLAAEPVEKDLPQGRGWRGASADRASRRRGRRGPAAARSRRRGGRRGGRRRGFRETARRAGSNGPKDGNAMPGHKPNMRAMSRPLCAAQRPFHTGERRSTKALAPSRESSETCIARCAGTLPAATCS